MSGSLLCVTFLQVHQLGLALVSFPELNLLCSYEWDSHGLTDSVQIFLWRTHHTGEMLCDLPFTLMFLNCESAAFCCLLLGQVSLVSFCFGALKCIFSMNKVNLRSGCRRLFKSILCSGLCTHMLTHTHTYPQLYLAGWIDMCVGQTQAQFCEVKEIYFKM